jgi:hypothetical protein
LEISKALKKLFLKKHADRINAFKSSTASFLVEIEPISFPSKLDDRVLVSKFMWAVTLITYDGLSENHAKICFEGMNNGKYRCKIGHFTGEKVKLYKVKSGKVKLSTRSEIWMISSKQVLPVIKLIAKERDEGVLKSITQNWEKDLFLRLMKNTEEVIQTA